ncbi:MAG: alpha/beta hydrolase [Erythrobacter sp.]
MSAANFHTMPDGRQIAFRHTPTSSDGPKDQESAPTLVFLPGYMSDMAGGKATAMFEDAQAQGRGCLLLDYSGCGQSSGDFSDGTLSRWRDEVVALITAEVAGPIVLAGSSMGGWLMILVAEALGARLIGIIGIAAAPDFIRWGYSAEQCATLAAGNVVLEDNPYGPDPTPTHPGFYKDALDHMRLDTEIAIDCPVRLLHGQCDEDVPWEISVKLASAMRSGNIQVTLIKDGDHRLSRDQDIALLRATLDSFY